MLYSIDFLKKSIMVHDAELLNKINNDPTIKTNLFRAIEAYKTLEIDSELLFIKYKEAGVNFLKDFEFLDISFYDRIEDQNYLQEIKELALELKNKKEGIIISFDCKKK